MGGEPALAVVATFRPPPTPCPYADGRLSCRDMPCGGWRRESGTRGRMHPTVYG